jgi:hypothetical protein
VSVGFGAQGAERCGERRAGADGVSGEHGASVAASSAVVSARPTSVVVSAARRLPGGAFGPFTDLSPAQFISHAFGAQAAVADGARRSCRGRRASIPRRRRLRACSPRSPLRNTTFTRTSVTTAWEARTSREEVSAASRIASPRSEAACGSRALRAAARGSPPRSRWSGERPRLQGAYLKAVGAYCLARQVRRAARVHASPLKEAIPAERERQASAGRWRSLELRSPRRWTASRRSCRRRLDAAGASGNHAKRTTTDHPAREDAAPMFWQGDTGSMLVIRVPPWDSQAMGAPVAPPPGSISTSTRSRHAAADRMRSRTCRTTFLEGD